MQRCREEENLARLFAEGIGALEQQDWKRSQRVLAEVVYHRPDYAQGGQLAARLLEQAVTGKRKAAPVLRRVSVWTVGILVVLVIGAIGMVMVAGELGKLLVKATPTVMTGIEATIPLSSTITPTIPATEPHHWQPVKRIGKGGVNALLGRGNTLYVASSLGVCEYHIGEPSYGCVTTEAAILDLGFAPDGTLLIAEWAGEYARIYKGWVSEEVETTVGPVPGHIGKAVFNPSGTKITLLRWGRWIQEWDLATGQLGMEVDAPTALSPDYAAYSPDGAMLAVRGQGAVYVYHTSSGNLIHSIDLGSDYDPGVLAFSPDGRKLAVSVLWGLGRLYDLSTGEFEYTPLGEALGMAFNSEGVLAQGGTGRSEILLSDVITGETVQTLDTGSSMPFIWRVHFIADDMLATWGEYGKVVVWDVGSAVPILEVDDYVSQLGPTLDLVYLSDGSLLYNEWPNSLVHWSLDSSARRVASTEWTGVVAVNKDEDRVAIAGDISAAGDTEGVVVLNPQAEWGQVTSFSTGCRLWDNSVTALAFSPDQSLIAAGSENGQIILYDLEMQKIVDRLDKHTGRVSDLAFADDQHLFSISSDGTLNQWNIATGEETTLTSKESEGTSLSVHDQLVAAGWDDGTVRIWNSRYGSVRTIVLPNRSVSVVAFSPSGKTLAVAERWTGAVRFYDTESGLLRERVQAHQLPHSARALAFSQDGMHLVSLSDDGTLLVWNAVEE